MLARAELNATTTATPTRHAASVIRAWRRAGRGVAIVSNNSSDAVEAYLAAHAIEVDVVAARTTSDAELLKPNPHLVVAAVEALGADPKVSTFVGDSVSDMVAAGGAGVASIGYANKPGKLQALSAAGATVVIARISALAEPALVR